MRRIAASLWMMGCLSTAAQPQYAMEASASACALLSKALVTQFTPYDKKTLDVVLRAPPQEDAVGQGGSECSYGGVTMNVDAFTPAAFERLRDATWTPVSNVGDRAYFRDNKGRWAEVYVVVGTHVVTVQMDIPAGRTAQSVQPNAIALAKALLPRLN